MSKKIYAVDLFCGAGGLTKGFSQAGINVIAGYDLDSSCQYAYESNNKVEFIHKDIRDVSLVGHKDFNQADIKILAGCAPCQPFSKMTSRKYSKEKHKNWGLLGEYLRIVRESLPEILTMENVPQLVKNPIFNTFTNELKELGYNITHQIVFCPDYGIPQNRRRLVLLASKLARIELTGPTHKPKNYKTVKDAIAKLPPIAAGESSTKDFLHRSQHLTPINLKRIKASKPGGTWNDWEKDLWLECHKKTSGKTYSAVYGRMEWNKPSPTITTQSFSYGTGRYGHPEQNRAISLREAAILQTFPKTYKFCKASDKVTMMNIGRMIGNAVPVKLGKVIGKSINEHLRKHSDAK